MLIIAGVFSFAAIFFLILSIVYFTGVLKTPVDRRISSLHQRTAVARDVPVLSEEKTKSLVASLGERVAPTDPKKRGGVKQDLSRAGYYSEAAVNTYWGMKIALLIVLPMCALLPFVLRGKPLTPIILILSLFACGLGFIGPDMFLNFKARRRRNQMFRALPDMLDLLVVCIEAGLGLDAAMQKVSEEFHISNPVLSTEFHITCAAIRLGQARIEALRDLGERTGVPDLKTLVAVLVQADRFGTSVGQALRVHADDMRTRRRQKAEELAAKTTVKLIFPLVVFIFPAIFVVLIGPAVVNILKSPFFSGGM